MRRHVWTVTLPCNTDSFLQNKPAPVFLYYPRGGAAPTILDDYCRFRKIFLAKNVKTLWSRIGCLYFSLPRGPVLILVPVGRLSHGAKSWSLERVATTGHWPETGSDTLEIKVSTVCQKWKPLRLPNNFDVRWRCTAGAA